MDTTESTESVDNTVDNIYPISTTKNTFLQNMKKGKYSWLLLGLNFIYVPLFVIFRLCVQPIPWADWEVSGTIQAFLNEFVTYFGTSLVIPIHYLIIVEYFDRGQEKMLLWATPYFTLILMVYLIVLYFVKLASISYLGGGLVILGNVVFYFLIKYRRCPVIQARVRMAFYTCTLGISMFLVGILFYRTFEIVPANMQIVLILFYTMVSISFRFLFFWLISWNPESLLNGLYYLLIVSHFYKTTILPNVANVWIFILILFFEELPRLCVLLTMTKFWEKTIKPLFSNTFRLNLNVDSKDSCLYLTDFDLIKNDNFIGTNNTSLSMISNQYDSHSNLNSPSLDPLIQTNKIAPSPSTTTTAWSETDNLKSNSNTNSLSFNYLINEQIGLSGTKKATTLLFLAFLAEIFALTMYLIILIVSKYGPLADKMPIYFPAFSNFSNEIYLQTLLYTGIDLAVTFFDFIFCSLFVFYYHNQNLFSIGINFLKKNPIFAYGWNAFSVTMNIFLGYKEIWANNAEP